MEPWAILQCGRSGTFTVFIAPREMLVAFLQHRPGGSGGTPALYICMEGSTVPACMALTVQVAGTPEEYLQALRNGCASLICAAYDPAACGPQGERAEELAETLRHAARRSDIILHATIRDAVLDSIAEQAERVVCTNIAQRRIMQPRPVRGRQATFRELQWGEASRA